MKFGLKLTTALTGGLVLWLWSMPVQTSAQALAPAGPAETAGLPPGAVASDKIYDSGVYVVDGKIDSAHSVPKAVKGTATASVGRNLKIASRDNRFNGVFVGGKGSAFTLDNTTIDLTGNIESGQGDGPEGVIAEKGAQVTLRKVNITTTGLVSSAATARSGAIVRVYDSVLRANGGTLPPGYVRTMGPGSLEPPAPLLIDGTARTYLATSQSRSYFYNSQIIAEGWGALSTDMSQGYVYLEANDCDIQAIKSGYGTYADIGARVVINRSRISAATYAAIVASRAILHFNAVDAHSDSVGVMIHNVDLPPGQGSAFWNSVLEINQGSLDAKAEAILIKSANADIVIDAAKLSSQSGVLVRSIVNPDSFAAQVKDNQVDGIYLRLRNDDLTGDILHEDSHRTMFVNLTHTTVRGAIRNVDLALDGASHWYATGDSQVVLRGAALPDQFDAPAGVTVRVTVQASTLKAGTYSLANGGTLVASES